MSMTPDRWRAIEAVFNEAVELDGVGLAAFLDERCAGDDELRADVERLIRQSDEADSFISQPLLSSTGGGVLAALFDETDEDPLTGKVVGRYLIEREIGRGGMGAVYKASRADGEYRQRVAVKVVKRGIDTDFVLRRFRNERQILAALDHPFITRLIDGGTTDDGRPYFVMEYIDGVPLHVFADAERMTIDERLRLFAKICDTVEYAHGKLVIHRDLKPSNILVTSDGGPRLLDFGIAKLLDPGLAADSLQPTATALRMMTLDYASPEQVRGEKVTYATDVYSLGVVLFELLTGRRPYRSLSSNPHDVAKEICDAALPLPSKAVGPRSVYPLVKTSNVEPALADIFTTRGGDEDSICRKLTGDLDNITLRAMAKTLDERYASVAELRADIEKHLQGKAVLAMAPSAIAAAAREETISNDKLVAVLPLSFLLRSSLSDTDNAYLTIGLADAIITRLAGIKQLTVRPTSSITGYNDERVKPLRAGEELGVDFVVDGRIRHSAGRLRVSLQLLDVKSRSAIWAGHFDEDLDDVLELEDAISAQVVASLLPHLTGDEGRNLSNRGTADPRAFEAYLKGRFFWNQFTSQSLPKVIESYRRAVEIDPNYSLAHIGIADFYIWASIYGIIPSDEAGKLAENAARRALELDPELGEAYATMGLLVKNRFEFAASERLFKRAVELRPNYSLAWEWYGSTLIGVGRTAEGLAMSDRAEELDPLSLRAKTLGTWLHYQAGEYKKALTKAEEIIRIDPTYPQGYIQRAMVLCELGRAADAVADVDRAAELMPDTALVQFNQVVVYAVAGDRERARAALETMLRAASEGHVKPYFLGMAHTALGEYDAAFVQFEKSYAEHEPWMIWWMTEPKLRVLADDTRYAELSQKMNVGVDTSEFTRSPRTAIPFDAADTIIANEPETSGFGTPIYKKRWFKRTAAASAVAGLFSVLIAVGYYSGFVDIAVSRGDQRVARPVSASTRLIAVLPFENATGDAANDYIADGMGDGLISSLTGFSEIRAVTRAIAVTYKAKQMDPQAIGREIGADRVLVGTLTRKDDEFVLNTQLINVEDGKLLFSMYFADEDNKILALQGKLISLTIDKLELKAENRRAAGHKSYTENNEAFSLYLKGEYNRQLGTLAGVTESIRLYKQALENDPNYALAHQGLALSYRSAPAYGSHTPQEAYPAAKSAAMTALSIDPSLGSAHIPLASIKFVWDWDFEGAEMEYKEAIRLEPNSSEAHYSYGNFLVAMGRTDDALTQLRIAQQIEPLSLIVASNVSWALYIGGRLDEAEPHIREIISRDPNFGRGYLVLGEIYQERGKFDEAIAAFQKSRQLAGDPLTEMALGHVYATAGRTTEARKIAADLETKVLKKEVSPFLPAVVHAGLNDKDKAFYWLERAYQERSNWLTLTKVGRRMKNLHGDPRFEDLLKRIGF